MANRLEKFMRKELHDHPSATLSKEDFKALMKRYHYYCDKSKYDSTPFDVSKPFTDGMASRVSHPAQAREDHAILREYYLRMPEKDRQAMLGRCTWKNLSVKVSYLASGVVTGLFCTSVGQKAVIGTFVALTVGGIGAIAAGGALIATGVAAPVGIPLVVVGVVSTIIGGIGLAFLSALRQSGDNVERDRQRLIYN